MDFDDLNEKATCPYNPNHIFDKEKLLFHLNRCKDKLKVGHLFKSCRYNSIHIIRKEDMDAHEIICSDRNDIRELTNVLRRTFRNVEEERERSREKVKREEIGSEEGQIKYEVKMEHEEEIDLDSCPLCKKIINDLPNIKKVVGKETLQKISKAEKLVKLSNQLNKMLSKIK